MGKTTLELLGPDEPITIRSRKPGRPRINRDLAKKFIKEGYTTRQIADYIECSAKSIQRIKKELIEKGELNPLEERNRIPIVEASFDKECIKATGISFYDWLRTKLKLHRRVFAFNRRVWERVWNRPSLVLMKDPDYPLGDELCIQFQNFFNEKTRIRARKKMVRYLFRFLSRHDLLDRHLRLSRSRDPEPIRRIPQISLPDFPVKLQAAIEEFGRKKGDVCATLLKFKIVTQMRTGKRKEDRGLCGMVKGLDGDSYLHFIDVDTFRSQVKEKCDVVWPITWIPKPVREDLFEISERMEWGDYYYRYDMLRTVPVWRAITKRIVGTELIFHDLRKISFSWLNVMGVPLLNAASLNVGWRDLNVARDHYLHLRGLLKKSERQAYAANIPEWFKEGLEEYL